MVGVIRMTSYTVVCAILVIDLVVAVFGGYAGYTTVGGAVEHSGGVGIESMLFIWNLITFQVKDSPTWLSGVFILINLMMVLVGVRMLRGVN